VGLRRSAAANLVVGTVWCGRRCGPTSTSSSRPGSGRSAMRSRRGGRAVRRPSQTVLATVVALVSAAPVSRARRCCSSRPFAGSCRPRARFAAVFARRGALPVSGANRPAAPRAVPPDATRSSACCFVSIVSALPCFQAALPGPRYESWIGIWIFLVRARTLPSRRRDARALSTGAKKRSDPRPGTVGLCRGAGRRGRRGPAPSRARSPGPRRAASSTASTAFALCR